MAREALIFIPTATIATMAVKTTNTSRPYGITIPHHKHVDVSRIGLLLPVEMIEQILRELWSCDLTTKERKHVFWSCCLVNRTFLDVFIHIALRDVHILGKSSAVQYVRILRCKTTKTSPEFKPFLLPYPRWTAFSSCRTITFHVDATADCHPCASPGLRLYSDGDTSAGAVSATLYIIGVMKTVPHLRKVKVVYTDWGFDDVFDQYRFLVVPPQVNSLEVQFKFSPPMARLAPKVRWRYEMARHSFGGYTIPNVKTLAVYGANSAFTAGMLNACKNTDTLYIDEHVELPVLPKYVRTLVIKDTRPNMFKRPSSSDWHDVARAASGSSDKMEMSNLASAFTADQKARNRRRLVGYCRRTGVQVIEI